MKVTSPVLGGVGPVSWRGRTPLSFAAGIFAAALGIGAAAGCGSTGTLPEMEPSSPPPTSPVRAPPEQFQLAPQPKSDPPVLAPLPTAPHRMAVLAKVRRDGAPAGEDSGAEAMLTEALEAERGFWSAQGPSYELVDRRIQEKALARDREGLSLRERETEAKLLANLAEADVDLLVSAECDVSSVEAPRGAFETRPKDYSVEATVSIVRVEDATTVGAGAGSARGTAVAETKRLALRDAAREALQGYRAAFRAQPAALVTLTIEGLRTEADSACVVSALRAMKGVLWVKPDRFQLAPGGAPAGIGRYELGWSGNTEDLKSILRSWDHGVRLEGTRFEGNRWSYRASGFPSPSGSKAATLTEEAKP